MYDWVNEAVYEGEFRCELCAGPINPKTDTELIMKNCESRWICDECWDKEEDLSYWRGIYDDVIENQ